MNDSAPVSTPDGPYARDVTLLQQWIASCEPYTPIDPTDPRYFDLEHVTVDGEPVSLRGEDQIEALCDGIRLSSEQSCQLFSGFDGTGKSTELGRLVNELEAEGYSVLLADARDYHDLSHALTIEDLLVIIAGALGEQTAARVGKDALEESYWNRLVEFLQQDVEISSMKLPTGVTDLKIAIKHANPYWVQVRNALAGSPGKLRDHSHGFIRRRLAQLRRAEPKRRGIVFVLDSLERLSPPFTEFTEVMDSVVRVLRDYPSFLRLPECHVIYAIPPWVQLISPKLSDQYTRVSLVLPAIKVVERGLTLQPYPPGIEALCALVARRIPIDQVFGSRRDLLEKLVIYSGGHVRTLVSFVRELLFRLSRKGVPSDEDVERAVQPYRERMEMAIWSDRVPLLDHVVQKGTVKGIPRDQYGVLADLMDGNIILCYRDGQGWYEIHPLVRDRVRELTDELAADGPGERPRVTP
ncbi:MAG: AAA family ATPase [bacterium]|nr:AAA family ATPase [bacterium]